jgi:hypothetical protein
MVVSMTQDEIIAMLRASCDKDKVDPEQNGFWVIHTPELEAFAKLVAQHEREACAKLCEEQYEYYGHDHVFAKAIRARGQA